MSNNLRLCGGCVLVLFASAGALIAADAKPQPPVSFNREIRPILSENCFFCHGPDQSHREAELRLDLRDEAVEAKAIVPGKPGESGLVARIFSSDPDELMPPPDSHKKLTPAQKELLKRWVAEGAEYQGHWSYTPPKKPAVPAGAPGIDSLVERRLKPLGLKPAAEADRRTLIRRLYFDLLGLPPQPAEVEAFVADATPEAYERLVDRLLASPHYGERMAIAWLDVVRFADTIGYHSDTPRNVWPYRDYVVGAFNENKPFDRFTVEQLAGDLLPGSGQQQQVASCFNRLLLTTEEGGAQAKDYEARMLGDRVRAVGAVWLGQTLGCCQCHDHKFDPMKARDFYSLGAFFADVREPAIGRREDGMNVPDAAQSAELARLTGEIERQQKELSVDRPELLTAQVEWEKAVLSEVAAASIWTALHPEKVSSASGVQFKVDPDESVFADRNPRGGVDTYQVTLKTKLRDITGLRLEALSQSQLPVQGPGRASDGAFMLNEFSAAASTAKAKDRKLKFSRAVASYEQPGHAAGAAIAEKTDKIAGWAIAGASGVNQVAYFEIAADADPSKPAVEDDLLSPVKPADEETTLVISLRQQSGGEQVLGRFRLSATTQARPLPAPSLAVPPPEIVSVVQTEAAQRTDADKKKLGEYFRNSAVQLAPARLELAKARKAAGDYEKSLPKCLVSVSMAPRTVRILPRGNWLDETGEVVQPALPKYLATATTSSDPAQRLTRLDLANWLVSRENPLTARVFVNRLWKQFFGIGLSKTLDDLGSQGEWPADPDLLDLLACEFMDSGWDVKRLVRTIVASHTYRQTSAASPELLARDPENRLLARQSRFRFDAELVRDNALAVSGLLVLKIGGPSVKPYQPDGYWENLNFPTRKYDADAGENQYRRGLYTWWQRSFVHPSMLAFDAPTREECAADRTRSNIPQQALVLLNDPTYVEAARSLAARIIAEGGSDPDGRIQWAFRQTLQRPPHAAEAATLRAVVDKQLAEYRADTESAANALKVGQLAAPSNIDPAELAAWTSVARVLLNLHETITRN